MDTYEFAEMFITNLRNGEARLVFYDDHNYPPYGEKEVESYSCELTELGKQGWFIGGIAHFSETRDSGERKVMYLQRKVQT